MSRLSKALIAGLLIGLPGVAATLVPCGLGLEEDIGLDLLFKLRGGVREAPYEVVVVTVDKVSADNLNLPTKPDKWPRSLHARLIENLVRKGAAVIAFDMTFDEVRSEAIKGFNKSTEIHGEDGPSTFYLQLCELMLFQQVITEKGYQ